MPGVLFVATHHKAMTTYFHAVLKALTDTLNIPFDHVNSQQPDSTAKIFLSMQGRQDFKALKPYRGVHIMRDPRDMIVSGYHYHKWALEPWLHRVDENGESYQEKLNRVDKTAGLFLEIQHFIFMYRKTLEAWDLADPDILESLLRSADGSRTRAISMPRSFRISGFEGTEFAFGSRLDAPVRSREPAWTTRWVRSPRSRIFAAAPRGNGNGSFNPEHLAFIEQELGTVLSKFGYS